MGRSPSAARAGQDAEGAARAAALEAAGDTLDAAEARFQALARAVREPVLIHEDWVVRDVNAAFTRLVGYERAELIGRNALELLVGEESRGELAQDASDSREPSAREIVLVAKWGERRIVHAVCEPIAYLGRPMCLLTMQDLTQRLVTDEERRREAALLLGIVDNTDQVVFVKDADGTVLFTNAAWRALFDETRPRDGDLFPVTLVERLRDDERTLLETARPITAEMVLPTRIGPRTFLTTKFPLTDGAGQPFAIGGIATDISARKRTTELLAAVTRGTAGAVGEAFFEALVRALAEGLGADYAFVGELLPGGTRVRTIATWSDGHAAAPLEYALDGTPCAAITVPSGATSCIHATRVRDAFPHDSALHELGAEGYVGVPIRGAHGQAAQGILGAIFRQPILEDSVLREAVRVTTELFAARAGAELERLKVARMQAEIRDTLERRVAERTAELVEANLELDAFASSVSHDLRAPLRHITGFAQLLERGAHDALSPESRRHLDFVVRSARRMGGLIDDLLSFSRTGRSTMQPMRFATAEVVEQVVREASAHRPTGVDWAIGALPEIHGDRPLLAQVFRNLIDNALKYSRDRDPARIEVAAEEQEGEREWEWVFRVRDNGVGFDPARGDRLFGVFSRLHEHEQFEGNGIGLANVRRIVHRHGGRVWAEGAVGRGATFYFSLPRAAPRS